MLTGSGWRLPGRLDVFNLCNFPTPPTLFLFHTQRRMTLKVLFAMMNALYLAKRGPLKGTVRVIWSLVGWGSRVSSWADGGRHTLSLKMQTGTMYGCGRGQQQKLYAIFRIFSALYFDSRQKLKPPEERSLHLTENRICCFTAATLVARTHKSKIFLWMKSGGFGEI